MSRSLGRKNSIFEFERARDYCFTSIPPQRARLPAESIAEHVFRACFAQRNSIGLSHAASLSRVIAIIQHEQFAILGYCILATNYLTCACFFADSVAMSGVKRTASRIRMTVRLLHQTDLFRPYIDPDDHWDLACVYALAASGQLELGGVLVDFPPDHYPGRSPDVTGVAQLSYLTGLPTHMAVGSSMPYTHDRASLNALSRRDRAGAEFILKYLRDSYGPAYISIVGSCRDLAVAAKLDPDLFHDKCTGIYLNAGTGHPDVAKQRGTEYNVELNAAAYAATFDIPCPIYWMPCFETMRDSTDRKVERFGTFYHFKQSDVLPKLSPALQSYFTYSLEARTDARYLQPLLAPQSDASSWFTIHADRLMWSTAGFFHMLSQSVDKVGKIIAGSNEDDAIFGFLPVDIKCDPNGVTTWTNAGADSNRFLFEVKNPDSYASAMTAAMATLLGNIQ